MEIYLAAAVTVTALASIGAAIFAFRAGSVSSAGVFAQFSDLVRRENELARSAAEEQARGLRQEINDTLRADTKTIDEHIAAIGSKLDSDITQMARDSTVSREALRQQIQQRLDESALAQGAAAKDLREEVALSLKRLGAGSAEHLQLIGAQQHERLEKLAADLRILTEKSEKNQETLRTAVESRLDAIRQENSEKLEQMRQTVDEKLQSTLEQRLGDSFTRVVEQLERVHNGLGEMKNLAAGVGDLKKVLTNVTVRGSIAEAQLGSLLEQCLAPNQYIENATVKDGSRERVEFAIRMPGRGGDNEVLLPIDAKFPKEDYDRLIAAAELGDPDAVIEAKKALETTVKFCAKTISEKYINPPGTTDFAILFLPTEGLYAEVLRKPGLFEQLQREFRVVLTGPVTLTALLNALQMGFRSLAIEKRSSEVWQVLGAVRTEFANYNKVVEKLRKNLDTAKNSVDELGRRTRVMGSRLKSVETIDGPAAHNLLGLNPNGVVTPDDEDGEEQIIAAQ